MYKMSSLEEFIAEAKNGVYNFSKDGKCTSCGSCCTSLLPMTKKEVKALKFYVKKRSVGIAPGTKGTADFTCPFRDEEKKICKVYEVRPLICRDFKCDKSQKHEGFKRGRKIYDIVNLREIFVEKTKTTGGL